LTGWDFHPLGNIDQFRRGFFSFLYSQGLGFISTRASKGYFAKQRNRRGRQEGYLIATRYDEIVTKQLFDGKTQLSKALTSLLRSAEKTLSLDGDIEKRQRTIIRVDAVDVIVRCIGLECQHHP